MRNHKRIIDKIDIRAYFTSILGNLEAAAGDGWTKNSLCPFHDESDGSFGVNMFTGQYKCFGCGAKGNLFNFHMRKYGVDFATALNELSEIAGVDLYDSFRHFKLGKPVKLYSYEDETGQALFYICRFVPKKFRPCDPNGKWKVKGIEPVPYNLPQVLEADTVFIAEGEKDADTIKGLGLVGTCKANWTGNWTREYANKYFKGKAVNILQDNDEPGRIKAIDAAENLSRCEGTTVKLIPPFSSWGL